MKFQFTGTALIAASTFAMAIAMTGDPKSPVYPISVLSTLIFFVCIAFGLSLSLPGPKVSLIAATLGLMFAYGIYQGSNNLGLSIFFFACMASGFSYAFPAKSNEKKGSK